MKRIILLLLAITWASFCAYSQRDDGFKNFYWGLGVELYKVNGVILDNIGQPTSTAPNYVADTVRDFLPSIEIVLSWNLPVLTLGNEFAIGYSPNLQGGFIIRSAGGDGLYIFNSELPQYLTFRYGQFSNSNSTRKFGIGAGIGPQLNLYAMDVTQPYQGVFVAPAAMIEFSFPTFSLRFNTNLAKHNNYVSTTTGSIPSYSIINFGGSFFLR